MKTRFILEIQKLLVGKVKETGIANNIMDMILDMEREEERVRACDREVDRYVRYLRKELGLDEQ